MVVIAHAEEYGQGEVLIEMRWPPAQFGVRLFGRLPFESRRSLCRQLGRSRLESHCARWAKSTLYLVSRKSGGV